MAVATAVDVLVVGAGSTGLTLALQAHAHGARVRIVERRPGAFRPSRALILHPRTLEVLRPLGVTDTLLELADTAPTVGLHLGSRVAEASLADLSPPDTAFPHLSLMRQTDVERVLAQALADRGVTVERGTELVTVRDDRHNARAVLRSQQGTEEIRCLFVAGCDGPTSTVRACAGIQDAVNLGWKLGFAASRSGNEAAGGLGAEVLLDSYDTERRQAAHRRLILTHTVFWAEASTGRIPSWLRAVAAPRAAPAVPILLDRRRLVAEGIRSISQLRVNYRHSALSVEGKPRLCGAPRPGDRLPDATVSIGGPPQRLHRLLAGPGVHVLLQRDAAPPPDAVLGPQVTVLRLRNSPGRGLIAVRPDGHIGFRCGTADVAGLSRWLSLIGAAASPSSRS